MGLDVGSKTIGVALADELGFTAQPLLTVRRTNFKADLHALTKVIAEHNVTAAVVGLPLNMNGTEGPSALESRKIGDALEKTLTVIYWDERLTTVAAQRMLIDADVSRARRKQVVDQIAAALILQGWMDSQKGLPE